MAIRRKKTKDEVAKREAAADAAATALREAKDFLRDGDCKETFARLMRASGYIGRGGVDTLEFLPLRQEFVAKCAVNPKFQSDDDTLELDGARAPRKKKAKAPTIDKYTQKLDRALQAFREISNFPSRHALPGTDPWVCREAINTAIDAQGAWGEALVDWTGEEQSGYNTDTAIIPDDLWDRTVASAQTVRQKCVLTKPRELYEEAAFERPIEWDVPEGAREEAQEKATGWAAIHPFLVAPPPGAGEPFEVSRLRQRARRGELVTLRPVDVPADVWQAYESAAEAVRDWQSSGRPLPGGLSGWQSRRRRQGRRGGKGRR